VNPADGENVVTTGGGQVCPSFGGITVGVGVTPGVLPLLSVFSILFLNFEY
jgi:hypothetical protein